MNYEIKSYNKSRYAIFDTTGKCLDDANGYGFKSKQSAHKAASYKFGGGEAKKKAAGLSTQHFIAENIKLGKPNLRELFGHYMECSFKELSRGEATMDELWAQLEAEFGTTVPKEVRRILERE